VASLQHRLTGYLFLCRGFQQTDPPSLRRCTTGLGLMSYFLDGTPAIPPLTPCESFSDGFSIALLPVSLQYHTPVSPDGAFFPSKIDPRFFQNPFPGQYLGFFPLVLVANFFSSFLPTPSYDFWNVFSSHFPDLLPSMPGITFRDESVGSLKHPFM